MTAKSAKRNACSNAVKLLQKPYLHLEESSLSDIAIRLVGTEKPRAKKSYDIVTQLDITSSDLCSPVVDVIDCSEQQTANAKMERLVVCLKRVISVVRTIFHVLQTVKSNKKVISIAESVAGVSTNVQIAGGPPFRYDMFINAALVASSEANTKKKARDNICTAAVGVFCKPYFRLYGSEHGNPVRLVGSDMPFEDVLSCESEAIPNNLLSTADFPAFMACFRRLSNKLKALLRNTATAKDVTVMQLALKATRLSSQTHAHVIALDNGCGYHCDLRIVSVFVANGEATKKKNATDEAYTNAAELLQKPYLRLAVGPDNSTMVVGSDKPFVELPPALSGTTEIDVLSSSIVEPVIDRRSEESTGHSDALALYKQNSALSDADSCTKCPVADASTVEAAMLREENQKQCADNFEIHGISNESSHSTTNQPRTNIAGNKLKVETPIVNDTADGHELAQYRKTVVTARSQNDLSPLINRFHLLAHMVKDVYAMFTRTKSVKDMLGMALNMCHMSVKPKVVKLGDGCVCCQLLIDNVLVAVAESCVKKSAKKLAFGIASDLLRMPYLCLEEEHDAVRLLGSDEPFVDISLGPAEDKVTSHSSRGLWLKSSLAAADAENKQDVYKPVNVLPCDTDASLSKLVIRFHALACRVKAICQSAVKVNNSYDIVTMALSGMKVRLKRPVIKESGVGYRCELSIDGVEIAFGRHSNRKKAMHAAFDAAVGLLKMQYLRLQEDPERNQSFKLIGSEQPFVGVLSGILPYDQNCIVDEKGKFVQVKQSPESGSSTHCKALNFTHRTHDSSKLTSEMCFEKSSDVMQDSGAAPVNKIDLGKTQISASTYSTDVSELVMQFRSLVRRVKCISMSSPVAPNGFDIIEMALLDIQLQKKRLIIWLNCTAFQCELTVDGVIIANGEGDTKKEAKQAAYSAAFELLGKPYLLVKENLESVRSYRLVGSDSPFDTGSSGVASYRQKLVTDDRQEREIQASGLQCAMMNTASCADDYEFPLQQHPAESLTDFVILENHFKKKGKASLQILQQSAAFNEWPLKYDLRIVAGGGYRCCLTLGSHTLADVVRMSEKFAKKTATEQALIQLSSTCYTLQMKEVDVTANVLTRNEVCIRTNLWN